MNLEKALVWFRRDLRDHDHAALAAALSQARTVYCAFIFDSTILDALYGWGFGWNRPHSNFDPVMGLNNAFGDMLLNFVMATMFLVLPTFWVAALGWAGVKAGVVAQNLATGSKDAKDSTASGVNRATR